LASSVKGEPFYKFCLLGTTLKPGTGAPGWNCKGQIIGVFGVHKKEAAADFETRGRGERILKPRRFSDTIARQ